MKAGLARGPWHGRRVVPGCGGAPGRRRRPGRLGALCVALLLASLGRAFAMAGQAKPSADAMFPDPPAIVAWEPDA